MSLQVEICPHKLRERGLSALADGIVTRYLDPSVPSGSPAAVLTARTLRLADTECPAPDTASLTRLPPAAEAATPKRRINSKKNRKEPLLVPRKSDQKS